MSKTYILLKDRAECLLALADELKQSFGLMPVKQKQDFITGIEDAGVLWIRKQDPGSGNIVKVLEKLAADGTVKSSLIYIAFPYITKGQSVPIRIHLKDLAKRDCRITWLAADEDDNGKGNKSEIRKICDRPELSFVSMNEYVLEKENESPRTPWDKMKDEQKRFMYVEYRLRYLFMGQNTAEYHLRDILVELIKMKSSESFSYTVPLLARESGSGRLSAKKTEELMKRFVSKGCLTIAGKSPSIDNVKRRIVKYAMLDQHVLIRGESGTGKENAAYFIHELSHRRTHKCIDINCAGLSDDLFISTLFGHVKGSYSGANRDHFGFVEEAKDGCIFLDELHQLSQPCQAKLLRFMQSGEYYRLGENVPHRVQCRVIAAGQPEALRNKLLPDLYNRLAVAELDLPSIAELKANGEDIITIAYNRSDALRGEHGVIEKEDGTLESITINRGHVKAFWQRIDATRELVLSYDWPGNTREMVVAIQQNMLYDEPWEEIIKRKLKNQELSSASSARVIAFSQAEIHSTLSGAEVGSKPTVAPLTDLTLETHSAPIATTTKDGIKFLHVTPTSNLLTIDELITAYSNHVYNCLLNNYGIKKGYIHKILGVSNGDTFNNYLMGKEAAEKKNKAKKANSDPAPQQKSSKTRSR
jgi:DNA-binding NtrC family response regulator